MLTFLLKCVVGRVLDRKCECPCLGIAVAQSERRLLRLRTIACSAPRPQRHQSRSRALLPLRNFGRAEARLSCELLRQTRSVNSHALRRDSLGRWRWTLKACHMCALEPRETCWCVIALAVTLRPTHYGRRKAFGARASPCRLRSSAEERDGEGPSVPAR